MAAFSQILYSSTYNKSGAICGNCNLALRGSEGGDLETTILFLSLNWPLLPPGSALDTAPMSTCAQTEFQGGGKGEKGQGHPPDTGLLQGWPRLHAHPRPRSSPGRGREAAWGRESCLRSAPPSHPQPASSASGSASGSASAPQPQHCPHGGRTPRGLTHMGDGGQGQAGVSGSRALRTVGLGEGPSASEDVKGRVSRSLDCPQGQPCPGRP